MNTGLKVRPSDWLNCMLSRDSGAQEICNAIMSLSFGGSPFVDFNDILLSNNCRLELSR